MHRISLLFALPRAIAHAVAGVFASDAPRPEPRPCSCQSAEPVRPEPLCPPALPQLDIVAVRRNRVSGEWELTSRDGKRLLARPTRKTVIKNAKALLRWRGGGEIRVMFDRGIAERIWVLGPHRGIESGTPCIGGKTWAQHQANGWKLFRNHPTFGTEFHPKPTDKSGGALIDLLQALLGKGNVATGNACMGGVPGGIPDQIGIYVPLHERGSGDLEKRRLSVRPELCAGPRGMWAVPGWLPLRPAGREESLCRTNLRRVPA
jgi:hypothetical protein